MNDDEDVLPPRSLSLIIRQTKFLIALFSALSAYVSMSAIMTLTPLIVTKEFSFEDSTTVIQFHVLGKNLVRPFSNATN